MSKTQKFINDFLGHDDVGVIEITKEQFDYLIEHHQAKPQPSYEIISNIDDIPIHPLQKIYLISDAYYSYPSGGSDWDFRFVFKYKGKHYMFSDCGGS